MVTNTFKSGNYNEWEKFILEYIPSKNNALRQVAIPAIDSALVSMLGQTASIEKSNVDVVANLTRTNSIKICYTLTYTCADFKNPEAPVAAISSDTEALSKAVIVDELELQELSIDVHTGKLTVKYSTELNTEFFKESGWQLN